jgi:signal recognition particle GTPase
MYLSADGAIAQQTRLETIANNMANVDTLGFKRELAVFQTRAAESIQRGLEQPGMGGLAQMAQQKVDTRMFVRMEAIINSMTPKERRDPDVLNGSRKRRITEGSGTSIQDLNRLIKQHKQMQKMMKKLGNKGAMQNMMRGLGGMLPPGGGFPGR